MKNGYGCFATMMATSTLAMFTLMYFNTYAIEHVRFSETRAYMALYTGAMMVLMILSFMLGMYTKKGVNAAIYAGAVAAFLGAVFMLRSQSSVQDVSWMKAMIPHHSVAILNSERADLSDPRVRDLAQQIVETQRLEIAEMDALITELEGGPLATAEVDGD